MVVVSGLGHLVEPAGVEAEVEVVLDSAARLQPRVPPAVVAGGPVASWLPGLAYFVVAADSSGSVDLEDCFLPELVHSPAAALLTAGPL